MSENEWVKLPIPNPTALPKGTRCRSLHGDVFRAEMEIRIRPSDDSKYFGDWFAERTGATYRDEYFSRDGIRSVQLPAGYVFRVSEVVKTECGVTCGCSTECADDDLGDTPEHLRELLRAARERVPGAVITDDGDDWPVLFPPNAGAHGMILTCVPDERAKQVERFGETPQPGAAWHRSELRDSIRLGRCYPTADARRIGREEFGMIFPGDVPDVKVGKGEIVVSPVTIDIALTQRAIEDFEQKVRRTFEAMRVTGGIASHSACPECHEEAYSIAAEQCDRCGYSPAGKERAKQCACGATSNLRAVTLDAGWGTKHVCGPCYQSKRRAELQAAKVEQLKGEMDRKVTPKWCEAPRGWPADAGEEYEL